jgi:hypothetical protein
MVMGTTLMSPLHLRRILRRSHRRVLVLLALLSVTGAFVVHHDMPMDMHGMSAGVACVAILAVGAVVAIGAAVTLLPRPWSLPTDLMSRHDRTVAPRSVPTRAGPLHLRLLVIRR